MYYDLEKKIDDYSAELFADLGLAHLTEERKADLYARLEDHLHQVIIDVLRQLLDPAAIAKIKQAIDQEDYRALDEVLKGYPEHKDHLETKIDEEFKKLKLTIAEEQKNAGNKPE